MKLTTVIFIVYDIIAKLCNFMILKFYKINKVFKNYHIDLN